MLKVLDTTTETEETPATPTLDDLAREGARRMLMAGPAGRGGPVCGRLPGGSRRVGPLHPADFQLGVNQRRLACRPASSTIAAAPPGACAGHC